MERTIVLLVVSISVVISQYQNERCFTREGVPGVCTLISRCQPVLQNIRGRQQPTICSFVGSDPVVCCPQDAGRPTTSRPTQRPTIARPTQRPTKKPTESSTQTVFVNRPVSLQDTSSKSEQKCIEYSRAVYQLVSPPTLTDETTLVNISVCAVVESPFVVGGVRVKLNEYPHMALLGYGIESNPLWACGGSLISELYVITAAHCLSSREEGQVQWARLGELDITDPNDGSDPQTIQISDRIAHPDYQPPARYNDIALLKLVRPATFSASVRPACLHRTKALPVSDREVQFVATGWGRTGYTEGTSDYLLKVLLKPIPHDVCNRTYRTEAMSSKLRRGIDDETMICAGEPEGGKDTCQGDSGGPLQYVRQQPYCMYNVVGITSFGKFCGFRNSPAVYTRVYAYIDWIEKIVWP